MDQKWYAEFARRLRCRMRHLQMKQKQLCELTGISQPTISKYMKGLQIPRIDDLHKIAKALECTTDELIHFDESDYYYH